MRAFACSMAVIRAHYVFPANRVHVCIPIVHRVCVFSTARGRADGPPLPPSLPVPSGDGIIIITIITTRRFRTCVCTIIILHCYTTRVLCGQVLFGQGAARDLCGVVNVNGSDLRARYVRVSMNVCECVCVSIYTIPILARVDVVHSRPLSIVTFTYYTYYM